MPLTRSQKAKAAAAALKAIQAAAPDMQITKFIMDDEMARDIAAEAAKQKAAAETATTAGK